MRFSILFLVVISSAAAQAKLGGDESSILQDRGDLRTRYEKHSPNADYTVHKMTSDSHTVREYINKAGTVFAVSWEGVTQPDLSSLFGPYTAELREQAQKSTGVGRAPMQDINTINLLVKGSAHARAHRGVAILKSAVPASLHWDDIK